MNGALVLDVQSEITNLEDVYFRGTVFAYFFLIENLSKFRAWLTIDTTSIEAAHFTKGRATNESNRYLFRRKYTNST